MVVLVQLDVLSKAGQLDTSQSSQSCDLLRCGSFISLSQKVFLSSHVKTICGTDTTTLQSLAVGQNGLRLLYQATVGYVK